jgi:hypothetical protein
VKPSSATPLTCSACQGSKESGQGQGRVPPSRNKTSVPGSDVSINLIGPWKVNVQGRSLIIKALTVINISTSLGEISRADGFTRPSKQVTVHFNFFWLARFPRPVQVVHDQGAEFTAAPPFQAVFIHKISPN